jgi:S-DNA-T family DNA segregation ATPase FtsK/SpoIIIE
MVSQDEDPQPVRQEQRAPAYQQAAPQPQAPRMSNLQGTGTSYVQARGNGEVFPTFGAADGEFARPTYQNYFFLAPNVRFTRTPDREIRKIRDDEDRTHTEANTAEARPAPQPAAATPAVNTRRAESGNGPSAAPGRSGAADAD